MPRGFQVTLNRLEDGAYLITESNDERLSMIAELLNDKDVRKFFANRLKHLPITLEDQIFNVTNSENTKTFVFKQHDLKKIFVNLIDEEEIGKTILFETDIANDTLVDLIYKIEEFMANKAQEINITREQDDFTITASY